MHTNDAVLSMLHQKTYVRTIKMVVESTQSLRAYTT